MKKHEDVAESMRKTPAYVESKELLARRKELQATIREVNSALRTLQSDASVFVNLAKADLQSEDKS